MKQRITRVLVVDDDRHMRMLLREFLEDRGFSVLTVDSGVGISRALQADPIDVLLLDLMLPGEDGLSICKRLRTMGLNVPIIMLTAKGQDVDRIAGLSLGADDYLPKPFNPLELVARIAAVLRRCATSSMVEPDGECRTYNFGPYELSTQTRRLTKSGQLIGLTSGEFDVLHALVRHPHQPLSREQLIKLSRGRELSAYDRSMDVQISRLRRLIEQDVSSPGYIRTVWGFGYVFLPEGTPA